MAAWARVAVGGSGRSSCCGTARRSGAGTAGTPASPTCHCCPRASTRPRRCAGRSPVVASPRSWSVRGSGPAAPPSWPACARRRSTRTWSRSTTAATRAGRRRRSVTSWAASGRSGGTGSCPGTHPARRWPRSAPAWTGCSSASVRACGTGTWPSWRTGTCCDPPPPAGWASPGRRARCSPCRPAGTACSGTSTAGPCSPPGRSTDRLPPALALLDGRLGADRAAEQPPLTQVGSQRGHLVRQPLGLHALGDDHRAELVGPVGDRPEDGARAVVGQPPHQRLVELHHLGPDGGHQRQARPARADVVQRDPPAQRPVVVEDRDQVPAVEDGVRLDDLEDQLPGRDARLVDDALGAGQADLRPEDRGWVEVDVEVVVAEPGRGPGDGRLAADAVEPVQPAGLLR